MPCNFCDDTGWKPVVPVVDEASDGTAVRRVVRCDCWRQNLGRMRLADANIPKRYQHCTIANFMAYNESLQRAASQARRLAESDDLAAGRGIFFEGLPGVGKTHLAVAVLKRVMDRLNVRG